MTKLYNVENLILRDITFENNTCNINFSFRDDNFLSNIYTLLEIKQSLKFEIDNLKAKDNTINFLSKKGYSGLSFIFIHDCSNL